MEITFTLTDIESLKRELTRLLPDIKSSHRVEAMARGLGWDTNAALRAGLATRPMGRVPDQRPFEQYLRDHGFADAPADALLHAVARAKFPSEYAAIQRVMEKNAELATWGYGLAAERSQPRAQREAEFRQDREDILTLNESDSSSARVHILAYSANGSRSIQRYPAMDSNTVRRTSTEIVDWIILM